MKKLVLAVILSTVPVLVSGCGPVAGLAVTSALQTADDAGEAIGEGIAKGLNCAFAGMFGYPAMTITFSAEEMRELLGVMDAVRIGNVKKFWSMLPPDMAETIKARIYQRYEANNSWFGSLQRQPVDFYTTLFARGMIWYRRQKAQSNSASFSKTVIEHYVDSKGRLVQLTSVYGVGIRVAGFPEPAKDGQSIRYCP